MGGEISLELKTETKDCLVIYMTGDNYGSLGYNFGVGGDASALPLAAANNKPTGMTSAALTGQSQQQAPDLLAVVLVNGRVNLLLDRGNGLQELMSDNVVADGQWHSVRVLVTPEYAQVQVDGIHTKANRSESGPNKWVMLPLRGSINSSQTWTHVMTFEI